MAEVMRRFGWLVVVAACHGAADCHSSDLAYAANVLGATWKDAMHKRCEAFPYADVYACKDGSGGHKIFVYGTSLFTGYYGGDGKLIGSELVGDTDSTECPTQYSGVGLSCDLTPIDLACQNTPP